LLIRIASKVCLTIVASGILISEKIQVMKKSGKLG